MAFSQQEILFYAVVAMLGFAGGVVRLCRDGRSYGMGGNIGRSLSAGIVSFGVVGLWVGRDFGSATGPFFYLAIAALIGYMSSDLQEKLFNRVVFFVMKKAGLIDESDGNK